MLSKAFIYSVGPLPTFLGHLNLETIFGNDRLCDSWFFLMDYCWKCYFCSYIIRKDKTRWKQLFSYFKFFLFYKSTLVPHLSPFSVPLISLFPISHSLLRGWGLFWGVNKINGKMVLQLKSLWMCRHKRKESEQAYPEILVMNFGSSRHFNWRISYLHISIQQSIILNLFLNILLLLCINKTYRIMTS